MILSDKDIERKIKNGELVTTQINKNQIQPASLDIRLSNTFCVPDNIPFASENFTNIIKLDIGVKYNIIKADRYILLPGHFVLGSTMECVKLHNNISAFVEGRSTYGRLGLFIQNAGWVDPGFEGDLTLELYNANQYAIELEAGKRIGQLVFAEMSSSAWSPYRGKYQFQEGATGSKVHLDVD